MRIGVNAYVKSRGISGSSTGARAIETALAGEHELMDVNPALHDFGRVRRFVEWYRWDRRKFEEAAALNGCQVLLNLANTGRSRSLPLVTVLHDTMVLDHWQLFDPGYAAYARLMFGPSVQDSDVVVLPSQHSKQRALARWPDLNCVVIPWPVPFTPVEAPPRRPESLRVVVVSSSDKHKRLPLAVDVVMRARALSSEALELVIVAKPGNDHSSLLRTCAEANSEGGHPWVSLRTGLTTDELQATVSQSLCVLSTSLDEGYCLPLVEAGALGIPVVHSGRGAMNEVAPDGSPPVVANDAPDEADAMASRVLELLSEHAWDVRAARSLENARRFSTEEFQNRWSVVLEQVG